MQAAQRLKIKKPEFLGQRLQDHKTRELSRTEIVSFFHQYGNRCKTQRLYLSSVIALKRALVLDPNDPDLLSDYGAALWNYGDHVTAFEVLDRSLKIRPSSIAHGNMGLVMESLGKLDDAEHQLREALELDSNHIGALWNLALLKLSRGHWEEGFNLYECRKDPRGFQQYPKLRYPEWQGEDLNNKIILIHGEQGTGDRILFSRYLIWLKEKYPSCHIKLITSPEMQDLMWDFRNHVEFMWHGAPYRDINADYCLFLMSLARFHGSTPHNIPPDPGLIRKRIEKEKDQVIGFQPGGAFYPKTKTLKVGIRWTGNPKNESNNDRSIPLEFLLELAENPHITLYNLQVGPGSERISQLGAEHLCIDVGSSMASQGYVGTAKTMLHLDLIITTCTSIAHLGGALGVPTWVLLTTDPYWCWLRGIDHSPWYPSVRLFRQPAQGDWISVVDSLKVQLKEYAYRVPREIGD